MAIIIFDRKTMEVKERIFEEGENIENFNALPIIQGLVKLITEQNRNPETKQSEKGEDLSGN